MSVINKRLDVSNLSKEQKLSLWKALTWSTLALSVPPIVGYFVRRSDRWRYGVEEDTPYVEFSGNITLEELLEELKNGTAYS